MTNKVRLRLYPHFKLGFTTANFSKVMPLETDKIKTLLDFAAEQGFSFIEIRDPQAKLTPDDCQELAAYANRLEVEAVYAMGAGLLDENYWEVFSRGIANSGVFKGPKVVRTATTGTEMLSNEQKKYWTADEFFKAVRIANKAANIAKMFGMQFSVENGREGLQGDGIATFGTEQFFSKQGVNENVGLQLDVANFFCTSRVPSQPELVNAFFQSIVKKVTYTHIKTSKDHKSTTILDGNELSFEAFFQELQKSNKNYVAIELSAAATTFSDVCTNHITSLEYLINHY